MNEIVDELVHCSNSACKDDIHFVLSSIMGTAAAPADIVFYLHHVRV